MKKLCILLLCVCLAGYQVPAYAIGTQGKHISSGYGFAVAVQADGTVKAVGDNTYGQCNTADWKDVVAVSAGFEHTLGLKSDGTVYATGSNELGQCNVEEWKDIVMIAGSYLFSYGLTRDGRVLCTHNKPSWEKIKMDKWKDIVWMDSPNFYIVSAIDKYGTPYTVSADLSRIRDAVQVYESAEEFVYILRSDGTVAYMNLEEEDPALQELDREPWSDIVALDCNSQKLIGVKRDGTVVGYLSFDGWDDIVEFDSGFGVRSDGSIMMKADLVEDFFTLDQLAEISTWKVMVDPKTIPTPAAKTAAP